LDDLGGHMNRPEGSAGAICNGCDGSDRRDRGGCGGEGQSKQPGVFLAHKRTLSQTVQDAQNCFEMD
jgi:hypothetical protein